MSTSPIGSPSPIGSASSSASQSAASSTSDLANQNVFLQLLVAQLQNQDPSNPADGTTFITQLAEFTEVSNTTQMAGSLTSIQQDLTPAIPPTTAPAATTTTN